MICNRCNQTLPDDSEFCQYCGTKLECTKNDETIEGTNPTEEQSTNNSAGTNIRGSLKGEKEFFDELVRIREEGAKAGKTASEIQQDVNNFVYAQRAQHIAEQTTIDKGEETPRETDAPQLPKETCASQFETANADNIDSPIPANQSSHEKKKKKKIRYCKMCGNLIDFETKKCTSCGKQYFKGIKFRKPSLIATILSVLLLCSIALNIVQTIDRINLKQDVVGYQEAYRYWKNRYNDKL